MEKICNMISSCLNLPIPTDGFEGGFYAALLLAALVFLLLVVLCLILKLILRKPAVTGVTLEREDGDIFISRNAIFAAVCRLEKDFPELEIIKVVMNRNRKQELGLTVTVLFDEDNRAFDTVAGEFKSRVFVMLNKSFGIESVKSVAIVLAKIPPAHDDQDPKNTAVVNNAFIAGV